MLDPTADSARCISLDYNVADHLLTMRMKPTGTVSRISLTMEDASNFLPPRDDLPSAQSSATVVILDSMLRHFDRLCELLGDALREVVLALFPWYKPEDDFEAQQADEIKMMRELRDQMPSMARQKRLVFRMSKSWEEYGYDDVVYETVRRHVFMRDSPYWRDVTFDD